MATESVAIKTIAPPPATHREHDLWIGDKRVLTIGLDAESRAFPPDVEHLPAINNTIQLLARAAKAVVYYAENQGGDTAFLMQPVEGIANAIILLSQLSDAVQHELPDTRASLS